ncbi:OprD family outer membrane porin [Pseudomonas moorei]|uniref:Outer membrane porin, OprD family n=1 Tax=Pseudomonas moorei TaxID=395599 RepID=A0A1H1G3T8_9PSED|nr:OprD family outer membrane porin [Pseudomonas moorei]KAB0503102.1 OprD family porin [Pseudomonas moorei]SDR07884.1 outer membrane porin, OprD family [Pseudomonas moorei]
MYQVKQSCCGLGIVCVLGIICSPLAAHADVIDDSRLKVDTRNFYLYRNYTNTNAPVSEVDSWSQGFDAQFTSGYTDTALAIGLDVDAQYALRLDSSGNDGSLPYSVSDQQTADDYSRAGATFKMRYSKTELKVGDLRPQLPVAFDDTSRQLDTIYQGAVVESREVEGLALTGGRFWSAVTRESSNHEKLYKFGSTDNLDSDGLDFGGATYDITRNLQVSYFYGVLHDIYKQHYFGLMHMAELGNGYKLKTDLRYFNNNEDGRALDGAIDNRSYGALFTLLKGAHMLGVSYQRMLGDSVFPTMNGYIPQPYLVHWSSLGFVRPEERSWGARYSYDFAGMGMPGLKFYTRYIKGTNWDRGGNLSDNQESERYLGLNYVVQSGALQGLGLDLRNIDVKQKYGYDYNEFRVATTYTWKFW